MKNIAALLLLVLLLLMGSTASANPQACPSLETEDPAWVLAKVNKDAFLVERTHYYRKNLEERFRKDGDISCKGVLYSLIINGREERIQKEVHYQGKIRYFLNIGNEDWKEGVTAWVEPDKCEEPTILNYVLYDAEEKEIAKRTVIVPPGIKIKKACQ